MNTIQYSVKKNRLGLLSPGVFVTSSGAGYLTLQFELDDDWAGLAVTVVAGRDMESPMCMLLEEGAVCTLPWEVTDKPGMLNLGLVGIRENQRLATNVVGVRIQQGAYVPGETPLPPSVDLYQQIIETMQKVVADAGGILTQATAAADAFTGVTVPAAVQTINQTGAAQVQSIAVQADRVREEVNKMLGLREQYALYDNVSETGIARLHNSAALPLWKARVTGADVAEGTPGVGHGGTLTVRACGENLVGEELVNTLLPYTPAYRNFAQDLPLPAGTYTFSCDTRLTIVRKRINGVSETISPSTPYTFTLESAAKVNFAFRIYTVTGNVDWTLPEHTTGAKIQIQAGSSPLPFIPYDGDTYALTVPSELTSAQDTLDLIEGCGIIAGEEVSFSPLPLAARHGATQFMVTGDSDEPAPSIDLQYVIDPNLDKLDQIEYITDLSARVAQLEINSKT